MCRTKGEEKEAAKKELIEGLKVLEKELGDKQYFGGETFGCIDLGLIAFYPYFTAFESFGGFSMTRECPKLVEWCKRCMQKETVSRPLYDHKQVHQLILEVRKMLGVE